MTLNSIGDLAQSHLLRRQNGDLKARMATLIEELSTGRAADISRHLSGSYSYLADIDRNLALLDGYETATSEAKVFTQSMQDALDGFQAVGSDLGAALISTAGSNLPQVAETVSARAGEDLNIMLAKLNTNVAGRFLFAGVATDDRPLSTADTVLTALRTDLAGETTLIGIETRLDAWFAPGGAFDTTAYQGATVSLPPFSLGSGETVALDLRGDDPAIRTLLRNVAMAALATDPSLGLSHDLQKDMLLEAGKGLTFDHSGLTRIRADLGHAQARIEESAARIAAERSSFQIARTELLSVDPYETVTDLEDVQFQLESLYTITARLSRLTLTDYLR